MRLFCLLLPAILTGCGFAEHDPEKQYKIALGQFQKGELRRAFDSAESGRQRWKAAPESERYWKFLLLRAEAGIALGGASEALSSLEAPPPVLKEIAVRSKVARANALSKLGRLTEALALLDEALPDAVQLGASPVAAQFRILRGAILIPRNLSAAEEELRLAAVCAHQIGQPYYEASALINLSTADFKQFHLEDALDKARQALALAEPIQARVIIGAAYGNIAADYLWLGDFDRAIEFRQKALDLQKRAGDERHLEESVADLGNLHMLENDAAGAAPFYEQAYRMADKHNLTADASKWAANLASALIAQDRWDEAERWNATALELKTRIDETRPLPFVKLNAAMIAAKRGKSPDAERLYREVIVECGENRDLEVEARSGLARIYADLKRFPEANREFDLAVSVIDRTRLEVRDASERIKFLSRLIRFYQDYAEVLVEQGRDDRAVEVVESSRALVLAERLGREAVKRTSTLAEFERLAKGSNVTFLSYWLTPKRSFVWAITPGGTERVDLAPGDLESMVSAHRKAIEDDLADPLAAGSGPSFRLSQAVLEPILRFVPKGGRVIVVPDGALHRVNFETLPIAEPRPHYWIEDAEVSIAPSLSVLATETNRPSPKPLLLIGAPAEADSSFPPPSHAAREAADIEKHIGPAEKLLGAAATPEAYRSSNPARFGLIHFAAHADANRVSPLDSSVILSRGPRGFRLYAREVAELPLSATLVTVSSCRSAGVQAYHGEGLVGFAWAFLGAGARNVIAGLWDVNDQSTATLMDSLYAGIGAGRSPAMALRQAKLGVMASGGNLRKPYYWGPFQLYTRSVAGRR